MLSDYFCFLTTFGQHLLIACFLPPAHIMAIYSTAVHVVIIIAIGNLKYIRIKLFSFFHENFKILS